jgi:hypothetical protein
MSPSNYLSLAASIIDVYLRPGLQIAKHALGKYIIAFACFLHIAWGIVLCIDKRAVNATPLSVIYSLLGNDRILTIVTLFFVAIMAGCFLDLRLRKAVNISALSMLLIPQQIFLWCSAGAGIRAITIQQYADGITRSWAHIAVDQSPVILMALLYTVALIEARNPPDPKNLLQQNITPYVAKV